MKRAIPRIPRPGDDRTRFDEAIKENIESIMGQRGGKIDPLPNTATLADVIAKVNEIISQMQ